MMSEALRTVKKVNFDLRDIQDENPIIYDLVEYKTNGFCEMIDYLGLTIWDSENDGYEWNEETNEYDYSKFEPYIRNKINEINEFVGKIKI